MQEHFIVIEQRLKEMDAMAIDMEVLSINPFWYGKDRDTRGPDRQGAEREAGRALRGAARTASRAFASLTLQFPDLAVQQLETAIKKQGLRGAAIGGSVLGEDFSDPKFHPVWAKAEELGAVLFIHPQSTPELAKRFKGNGWLSNTIGNPLDTTIALQHLIFEGTLDRFPGLKIIAAHGGGYLGSYAPRSRSCLLRVAAELQSEHQAEEEADRNISTSSISTRWCSRRKRYGIWWRRSARARSCSAPTIRSPGKNIRSTMSSPPRR